MSTTTLPPAGAPTTSDAAPPSLLRLTRVELRKSYDTRAGFWLLLLIGLASLAVVVLQLVFAEQPEQGLADYFTSTQLPVGILLPVPGILLVTSEWSQRTAMTTFALVPRRSRVLTAKVLAAAVLSVLGVAAAAATAVLGAVLTPVFSAHESTWTLTAAHVGQVVAVQIVTVLIGVAFGMLLLNSPLAIVLYFVLPTIVTIVSTMVAALDWVREWLDLTTTSAPLYDGSADGQGWLQFATSVALWGVLPMVAGWLRIQRSEIS
jgi:ABC-2 type transport system permease protein